MPVKAKLLFCISGSNETVSRTNMSEAFTMGISEPRSILLDSPLPDGCEKRHAPRVAAGRPGRMRVSGSEGVESLRCGVVDISHTGCRVILPRRDLPAEWTWSTQTPCSLTISFSSDPAVELAAELVWHQRTREGFDVLGLRFMEPEARTVTPLDKFILLRLRTGVALPENVPLATAEELTPLDVPLEAEGKPDKNENASAYHFRLMHVGAHRIEAVYDYRDREEKRIPNQGSTLSLTVHPPVWARGELRTLRFSARVIKADENGVTLQYGASGNDLSQMILRLIPDRIVPQKKPSDVDVSIVMMILLALIILLLMSSFGVK